MRSRITAGIWAPASGHLQFASLSSAQSVVTTTGSTVLFVQVLNQNVRMCIGGDTPTASKGFRLTAGTEPYTFEFPPNTMIKFIEETSGAAVEYQLGQFYGV